MFRALLLVLQSLSCVSPELSKHGTMGHGVHWQPKSHPAPNLCIRYHLKPCAPRHTHSCKVQVEFWLRAIEPHCKAPCMRRREASGNGAQSCLGIASTFINPPGKCPCQPTTAYDRNNRGLKDCHAPCSPSSLLYTIIAAACAALSACAFSKNVHPPRFTNTAAPAKFAFLYHKHACAAY